MTRKKPHKTRTKWFCKRCGIHTGRIREHYYITPELWLQANLGQEQGMLCIGCVEFRIGRRLTPKDFPAVHINDPRMYEMSARLISRIRGYPTH